MNNKDNLMILGKDRRSFEQEGFEPEDQMDELEAYTLGDDNFELVQKLSKEGKKLESVIEIEADKCQPEEQINKLRSILEGLKEVIEELKGKE